MVALSCASNLHLYTSQGNNSFTKWNNYDQYGTIMSNMEQFLTTLEQFVNNLEQFLSNLEQFFTPGWEQSFAAFPSKKQQFLFFEGFR